MKIAPKMVSVAAVLLSANVALAAPVAVVRETSGQVSIQTVEGIVTANRGTQLSEGDRLAVGNGSATVSYLRGKCKGEREIGPRSIAVISVSGKECSKRIEGAKAQSSDPDLSGYILPGAAILAGGGIAAGLAASNSSNGGSAFPVVIQISP
ncbi:hypothetical protein [Methylosinus sp. Sm6]|uniref:hypothetical protein n=1 Tax=Methylosinus sp. Sm6 TaxID=2866948 RepID=UPI001C98E893|nr:hypothetical protein [Methylosinus sp. Sm6]MBY6242463.1 hypothetical protein [Methylosinus sp. Sm6]